MIRTAFQNNVYFHAITVMMNATRFQFDFFLSNIFAKMTFLPVHRSGFLSFLEIHLNDESFFLSLNTMLLRIWSCFSYFLNYSIQYKVYIISGTTYYEKKAIIDKWLQSMVLICSMLGCSIPRSYPEL